MTGNAPSICTTHFDKTDSLLLVLRGSKHFLMKPPRTVENDATQEDFSAETPHGKDGGATSGAADGWLHVELKAGDGLLIPRDWWHSVKSEPQTVALSLRILINNGAGAL